jgi:hypothetical protein
MAERIAVLQQNVDPKKWFSGRVSAVQENGLYVGVIEGKDAFVPSSEMPAFVSVDPEAESGQKHPDFNIGQTVSFRLIRYAWQNDSLIASMLSYDDSLAKRRAARGQVSGGATSAPPAARAVSRQLLVESAPPERAQTMSKTLERFAARGFSVLDDAAAKELNDYIKESTRDKKQKAQTSKAAPSKTEKKYVVNFVRGMNEKVIGQLTMANKCSEKEIKDAALAMAFEQFELKAGQQHKGITITKNIIAIKA